MFGTKEAFYYAGYSERHAGKRKMRNFRITKLDVLYKIKHRRQTALRKHYREQKAALEF